MVSSREVIIRHGGRYLLAELYDEWRLDEPRPQSLGDLTIGLEAAPSRNAIVPVEPLPPAGKTSRRAGMRGSSAAGRGSQSLTSWLIAKQSALNRVGPVASSSPAKF